MLQIATCISSYEPMSDLVKVGDRCEIDINHYYVGDDGVAYVEVYRPSDHKIGDMPIKHFSLINENTVTLAKDSVIDFIKLGHKRCAMSRTKIVFESAAKVPKMYDIRRLTDEYINRLLAEKNLKRG